MHLILIVCVSVIILDLIRAAPTIKQGAAGSLDKEVFIIPRKLKVEEEIHISGLMTTKKERLTVNLVKGNGDGPDYSNVACQVKLEFPGVGSKNDSININTIVDGHLKELDEGDKATHMFTDDTFAIKFQMTGKTKIGLGLTSMDSSTKNDCKVTYGIDEIKYVTVGGDVHKIQELKFLLV